MANRPTKRPTIRRREEWVEIEDADGTHVRLYPSSGVLVYGPRGEVPGPFLWLDVEPKSGANAAAHITRDEARAIRDALTAFLLDTDGDAAPSTVGRAGAARPGRVTPKASAGQSGG